MSARRIEPIKFGTETVWIEVTEVDQQGISKDGFENVSAKEAIEDAAEIVRSNIAALATTIQSALAAADPKEWSIEVNFGFKGSAGIPFVTTGEANGAVKVTAKWAK